MNLDKVARRMFPCLLTLILCLPAAASAQRSATEETSQSSATESSSKPTAPANDDWQVGITPYLWFAGVHGTVGALGHETGVHASFLDIFSFFNIGLMGELEARKKRVLLTTDIMWMRLSDERAIPVNDAGIQSIEARIKEFLLTPGVGYRVLDTEKIKVDALVGFRYWHLGETLEFTPSLVGDVFQSQNWVDALGGARIHIPLSQKAMVTIGGDAGGGGAASDYQVAGLLGYKIGNKYMLQAGWRYLDVNYRGSNSFVFDAATSGVLFGLTINLK